MHRFMHCITDCGRVVTTSDGENLRRKDFMHKISNRNTALLEQTFVTAVLQIERRYPTEIQSSSFSLHMSPKLLTCKN